MNKSGRELAAALAVLAALGVAPALAEGIRVAPHPAPLPTAAIDPSRFPENGPERRAAAGERTFVVSPRGRDGAPGTAEAPFRTIRRALAALAASGGGRVVVRAGTYAEGEAGDDRALRVSTDGTIVETPPGERATVRPAGAHVKGGLEIAASRVTLSGIAFEGFASDGIAIGAKGATLSDIVIADLEIALAGGGDGISVWPDHRESGKPAVEGLLIERARIAGADLGITVGEGPIRDLAIREVFVKNRAAAGGGSGADAIAVERGDNILLNGVEVAFAEADGIDLKATRAAVVNAHVHHVRRNGIKLWGGGDIVNALVHDCGADASIVLEPSREGEAARYRIVHSAVAFHNRPVGGERAYVLSSGYDEPLAPISLEVANTVFYRNPGALVFSRGTKAAIRNCAFFGAGTGQVLEYAWDGRASKLIKASEPPAALERAGAAAANLPFKLDPLFARPGADSLEGFVPSARSPLVNAGARLDPPVAVDLLGRKRVRGPAPDIGPIEAR